MMSNTGLTDLEKESLIKLFLTNGELVWNREDVLNGKYQFKIFEHSQFENLPQEYAHLILKTMNNLRNSALGF